MLFFFSRLIRHGGFTTEERDRSSLPKDFPQHIPGTCHFVNTYKHKDVPENDPLYRHIEAGLADIGIKAELGMA